MKTEILNVRVSEQIIDLLREDSLNKQITISENVRIILSNHFGLDQCLPIHNSFDSNNEFYNSNEFIYLVAWLFQKKGQPQVELEKQNLLELQNITSTVIRLNILPIELISEFKKVLLDLDRVINENYKNDIEFRFCKLYEDYSFDYTGLLEYITQKAVDDITYI